MKVLVSGGSGFIGSALSQRLVSSGHRVVWLTRSPVSEGADAVQWDPDGGKLDPSEIEGFDGVVHLAGEGITARPWTDGYKARLLTSRVRGTTLLCSTLARLDRPPPVLVSASAIGYFGDRGAEVLTEESSPGSGFHSDIVVEWEEATRPAAGAGIRVCLTRSGVVLDPHGGALPPQTIPFRLFVGGKLGSGEQFFSWITLEDETRAMEFLLDRDELSGPVNLTSPNPVTNAQFTEALGRVLGRPTLLPVPRAALKLLFGTEMVDEFLLASLRVLPTRLQDAGFKWSDPQLEPALRRIVARGLDWNLGLRSVPRHRR